MKLHVSAIERIVTLCENYGGHRNQQRLKDMLTTLDFADYERQTGEKVIVLAEDLEREKTIK